MPFASRGSARGDGDGWVVCDLGHRHWGRFGAAGLLLGSTGRSLLQLRAPWTHQGGVWGVPGGARDSAEDAVTTALREAHEEAGLAADRVRPIGWSAEEHGGWSYTTVVAGIAPDPHAPSPWPAVEPVDGESTEVRWWDDDDVLGLDLHPGVRDVWPRARPAPAQLHVVVDVANVIGAVPNGWWRDRAGAATRLLDRLLTFATDGISEPALPIGMRRSDLTGRYPLVTAVLEAAFRDAAVPSAAGRPVWTRERLRRVLAPGSGDDAVVETVIETVIGAATTAASTSTVDSTATASPAMATPVSSRPAEPGARRQTVVVTADRDLRHRVGVADPTATLVGPRWLLDLL